jgi:hypothetical protein
LNRKNLILWLAFVLYILWIDSKCLRKVFEGKYFYQRSFVLRFSGSDYPNHKIFQKNARNDKGRYPPIKIIFEPQPIIPKFWIYVPGIHSVQINTIFGNKSRTLPQIISKISLHSFSSCNIRLRLPTRIRHCKFPPDSIGANFNFNMSPPKRHFSKNLGKILPFIRIGDWFNFIQ